MKKYYEYLGLALIMAFSFYYTEKIANIVLNKNPLMQEINKEKASYEVESVNAIVEGDYITPGINGLKVNAKDSFYKMQQKDVFNKYFLVYEQTKPDISIENNKNKIIREGNPKQNKVALIFEKENELSNYIKEENLKATLLVNKDTYTKNNYFEVINNDYDNFRQMEDNLNLNKENKNICVLNNNLKNLCLKYHNYLVEPELVLNSSNFLTIKKNITNGSIILIKSEIPLTDLKLLIKEIKYKGLEFVYLSEIISEEYHY